MSLMMREQGSPESADGFGVAALFCGAQLYRGAGLSCRSPRSSGANLVAHSGQELRLYLGRRHRLIARLPRSVVRSATIRSRSFIFSRACWARFHFLVREEAS